MKRVLSSLILFMFIGALAASAVADVEKQKATPIEDRVSVKPPEPRVALDACALAKTNGTLSSYFSGFGLGMINITYFDPIVCTGVPTYPFEITAFSFSLYDNGSGVQWPVQVDIVVYDLAVPGDPCSGPGQELCRHTVSCDEATFSFPEMGTVDFPTACCVVGPFYIGLEYTDQGDGPFPSIAFDDQTPVVCDNWFYYGGTWYEWYDIWSPPPPGYPLFWVDGQTPPNACVSVCDNHKMHFPQMPNVLGWDVMATEPIVLADDWMCSETGVIWDIHFWGSWRDLDGVPETDDIGVIQYFVISIHEDDRTGPFSKPGPTLREWEIPFDNINATQFDPQTDEGWYDPMNQQFLFNDHRNFWRYDIVDIPNLVPDPFIQEQGIIYWINISAVLDPQYPGLWGWKSTLDRWEDDAVWALWGVLDWMEMYEPPDFSESLNLAFCITSEPITVGACCWPDGSCTDGVTPPDCVNSGGTFMGLGTLCSEVECPTQNIPTLTEWGMLIMLLLLVTAGTIAVVRRRKEMTART